MIVNILTATSFSTALATMARWYQIEMIEYGAQKSVGVWPRSITFIWQTAKIMCIVTDFVEPDAVKYRIYDALEAIVPRCRNWDELRTSLAKQGITVSFTCRGTTTAIQGVVFEKEGLRFNGSKVDRKYKLIPRLVQSYARMRCTREGKLLTAVSVMEILMITRSSRSEKILWAGRLRLKTMDIPMIRSLLTVSIQVLLLPVIY